jgi:hypothetical protein
MKYLLLSKLVNLSVFEFMQIKFHVSYESLIENVLRLKFLHYLSL